MRKLAYWTSLIFVFTIPWETVIQSSLLGSISRLVGFGLAAAWLLAALFARNVRKPTAFHAALSLFVAWNAASMFWSASPEKTATLIVTWLQLLLLSLIFWDLYTSLKDVIAALQMYILGAYVVLGDTIANFVLGNAFYHARFSAAGTSPDDTGVILALGIPIAAYLTVYRQPDRLSIPLKTLNYLYILLAFIGIALSGTRTALVVAVPGVLFTIFLVMHSRLSAQIRVGLLAIIGATVVLPRIPVTSIQRLETTKSSMVSGGMNGRERLWREGFASFVRHPWLGVGVNMFRSVNTEDKVAHNSFISVLVELGMLGFFLFILVVIIAGIHIFGQPPWDKWLWLTIFVGWVLSASALTWEYRKPTWLFLNLIVVSAAAAREQFNLPFAKPHSGES